MNDENKTIADLLKSIDDKTVDQAEVIPILKSIERNTYINTGKAIATAIGTAVSKAMEKPGGGKKVAPEPAKAIAVPGVVAPEPAKAKATSKAVSVAPVVAAVAATVPSKKTVYATQSTTTPAVIVRDVSGKFTSKTTATDGVAQQRQDNQNDKLSSILKDAVGSKKETIKNTAGRMVMGQFYDVGKELLEATGSMRDNAKDEKSTMGRLKNWGKAKMGIKPNKAEAAHDKAQAKHDKVEAASDKAEAKHDQLQAKADKTKPGAKMGVATGTAVMAGGGGEGGGFLDKVMAGKSLKDMWKNRKGVTGVTKGGGMLARGAGVMRSGVGTVAKVGGSAMGAISNLAGPLMSGISLPLVAAAGAAAFGIAQFGKALTTGESDVNNWFKKLTGLDAGKVTDKDRAKGDAQNVANTKRVNAERVAQGKKALEFDPVTGVVKSGAVAESQESGGGDKGAGVISSGKNDAGGKSYGLKQFASAKGKDGKSSLGEYAKNSKYAAEFKGLDPGSAEFDKKWSEINTRDNKGFAADQRNYVNKTMTAPVKKEAAAKGFDTKDVGISEALTSQSVQHGPGGNSSILKNAQTELTQKYGSVDAAPKEEQLNAIYTARKAYANKVADNMDRKGQTGEAKNMRAIAGEGGRYDQELAQTKALSASGGTSAGIQVAKADAPGTAAMPKSKGGKGKKKEAAPVVAIAKPKPVEDVTPDDQAETEIKTALAEPASVVGTPERKAKKSRELRAEREAASVASATALPATAAGVVTKKADLPSIATDSPVTVATSAPATTPTAPEVVAPPSEDNPVKTTDATPVQPVTVTPEVSTTVPASSPATAVQVATATQSLNATVPPAPAAATGTAQPAKKKTGFFDSLTNAATGFASGFAPNLAKSVSLSDPAATVAGKVQIPTTVTGAVAQAQPETVRLAKRSSQGVQTLPPLPQPQVAQVPLPPPVEVPGLERLAKSQEQQAVKKPDVVASAGIPNIKTDFDDTMLVLMSYDRI